MKKIKIEGMMCEKCAAHVKNALEKIGTNVLVVLNEGVASVDTNVSDEEIKCIIENIGYDVLGISNE